MNTENFPIDLNKLKPLKLDPGKSILTPEQKATLQANIQLCRDAIVFFTAVSEGKGLTGHTGGSYDTMPEVNIIRAFIDGGAPILPVFFDEAGHRVATQYLLSVLEGAMPAEKLLHYREYDQKLPGHPELGLTPGVKFSSGRLGHIWAMCNGVQMGNPDKAVFLLGSDGAQMEGDDAEAARLCVAKELNVKVIVDDNNVTISGHPHAYLPGYDIAKTLAGHGLSVEIVDGEDLDKLYAALAEAFITKGPHAVVVRRLMAPGIPGLEGEHIGHDAIKVSLAIPYLEKRGGYEKAIEYLKTQVKPGKSTQKYKGSSGVGKNRDDFGKIISGLLDGMTKEERISKVRVFDNDFEGSQGLHHIRKNHAEVYVEGGIMERGNFSAAAGFSFGRKGAQGIYSTFSAFLEMVISELTMARLNFANVFAHFSHAGVDDMADNTCHFGLNNMFADNGLPDDPHCNTHLYFPCDQNQFKHCVKKIFTDDGLRFLFSTRSAVPDILKEDGKPFFDESYKFQTGKDDVIRDSKGGGYVIAFGDLTYRALDAVITLQEQGTKVGLINKATLNVHDPATFDRLKSAPFVLVVECFNISTGVGSRFGTELLKRGYKGKYNHLGTHKEGPGGTWQQIGYQGLESDGIQKAIKALL